MAKKEPDLPDSTEWEAQELRSLLCDLDHVHKRLAVIQQSFAQRAGIEFKLHDFAAALVAASAVQKLMGEARKVLDTRFPSILDVLNIRMCEAMVKAGTVSCATATHTFTAGAESVPRMPKEGTDEYLEFVADLRARGYGGLMKPTIHWKALQSVCDELNEKGEPEFKHLKVTTKAKVAIRKRPGRAPVV